MARASMQGLVNIIRFNWHFYVLAGVILCVTWYVNQFFIGSATLLLIIFLAAFWIVVSLAVSYFVYDRSKFYELDWLDDLETNSKGYSVNIHAGFDETSTLIKNKFPEAILKVWDFYDPKRHTEISIKRARNAFPSLPETVPVDTSQLPNNKEFDTIFLIFAAHEIRDRSERQRFFEQLNGLLKPDGKIIVVEHLRDLPNFIAFTIGFFHFYSRKSWLEIFSNTNFGNIKTAKFTPFVSIFILSKA